MSTGITTVSESPAHGGRRRGVAIAVRILQGLLTLAIIVLGVFLLTHAQSPTSIALANLPPGSRTAQDVQGYIKLHQLNQPLLVRLGSFIVSLAHGQLGESAAAQQPVTQIVYPAFARTLSLVVPAFVVAILIAVRLGAYLAENAGRRLERLVTPVLAVSDALPSFVIGVGILFIFAVKLNWFQISTQLALSYGTQLEQIKAYVMPFLALVLLQTPYYAKIARQAFADVLSQPYARSAILRGLKPGIVRWRCVLPNTASVLAHSYGIAAATVISGTLIIENVFSFPGIGRLAVTSISNGDQPTLVGIVVLTSAWLILISTLSDSLSVWMNPKLKTG